MTVIVEENVLISSIDETIKESLHSLLSRNFLERSYKLEVSQGLLIQLVSDWTELMGRIEEESAHQQSSNELSFKNQKRFLTNVFTIVVEFFERYSEFSGQDFQTEIEKFKVTFNALINLMAGVEQINASGLKSDATEFLEQLYSGTDLVVDVAETHATELPISILSSIKVVLIHLPVRAQEILEEYSLEEQNQKAIRKYLRQLDRAITSGISRINDTINVRRNQLRVESEEELLKAQIEHNFVPMQLVEFWLREDQQRVLRKEEESETQLLMEVIDGHRERQFFK